MPIAATGRHRNDSGFDLLLRRASEVKWNLDRVRHSGFKSEFGDARTELVGTDDFGLRFATDRDAAPPRRRIIVEPLAVKPIGRVRNVLRIAVVGPGEKLCAFQQE